MGPVIMRVKRLAAENQKKKKKKTQTQTQTKQQKKFKIMRKKN